MVRKPVLPRPRVYSMTVRESPSPAAGIRVLLVDDHPIMHKGMAGLLATEPDLTICAHAENAVQALAALRAGPFDLVILDVSLRGVSGIDLLKDIRLHWPKLPVLMFSMHDEMLYAERTLRAGARGYVMKQEAVGRIITAIRRVLAGHLYVSEAVNGRVLNKMIDGGADGPRGDGDVIDRLSNRELEVFRFIGRGHGTRAIAGEMRISVKTVETYRAHIKEKLALKTAPELMRLAIHWISEQDGVSRAGGYENGL